MQRFILAIGILLLGCHDTPTPPSWYYESQSDTNNLYGVGNAKNLQTAKDNAIADMLSHMQVSISSNSHLKQQYRDGVESSTISQSIDKDITKTTLSNVSYTTKHVGGEYFVRAQITKQDFIAQLQKTQKQALQTLQSLNLTCQDITLSQYKTLAQELDKAFGTKSYLDALGETLDISLSPYMQILESNSPKPTIALVFESSLDSSWLKNYLQKELIKFYRLSPQSSQKITISFSMPTPTSIKLHVTITDCNANPTFVTQISESLPTNASLDTLGNRVGVLLYKKLLENIQ
ncbi:LPP20 family lipoprotein [Helicobacter equorum]|uniref:LPP20 family lipoprotein n=1 Tax=Helicobacter equorum TaxID=361872 RepID=UPI000CF0DDE4|nr:LPP20 family lipoprotein [Helicobacter equorum]